MLTCQNSNHFVGTNHFLEVFDREAASQLNERSSTACAPLHWVLLSLSLCLQFCWQPCLVTNVCQVFILTYWGCFISYLCSKCFRTELRLSVCSLLKQLLWFRFLPCCSQRMPGFCLGKCLPVIWGLDRDRLRMRLLFWTDPPNSHCILPLSSLSLRMFFLRAGSAYTCFVFFPVFHLKKEKKRSIVTPVSSAWKTGHSNHVVWDHCPLCNEHDSSTPAVLGSSVRCCGRMLAGCCQFISVLLDSIPTSEAWIFKPVHTVLVFKFTKLVANTVLMEVTW